MSDFTPDRKPYRPDISLIQATVDGYVFIKDHFDVLVRWSMLPILVNFFNYLLVDWQAGDSAPLESFLYSLPGTVMFAWYVCAQARLQVLGEKIGRFPDDSEYRFYRHRHMVAGISCYVLFQMAVALLSFAIMHDLAGSEGEAQLGGGEMVIALAGLIILLWILKYGVLHLVTAVGGDVRDYLDRVKGFWFSFILAGTAFVSTLPVMMFFLFIISAFMPSTDSAEHTGRFGLYALGAIMGWALAAVLNAALVGALKQLYNANSVKRG